MSKKTQKNQTILITGGAGYIGTVLTPLLLKKGYKIKVLDRLFFGKKPIQDFFNNKNYELIKGDIRNTNKNLFKNVHAVIHLAALSNDPSCDIDSSLTQSINYEGTIKIAKQAKQAGVKKFLFSSSCSVYGGGINVNLTEQSSLNPVSLYAKLKAMAEKKILQLADDNFAVIILRNPTVYGMSKRMRFDLVVNVMTLSAFEKRKIYLLGGGTQWRPLIHVHDLSRAFIQILEAPLKKVQNQIFNVGSNKENYQMFQIAEIVKKIVPSVIEKIPSDQDKRTYNVSFDKINKILNFKLEKTISQAIKEIHEGLIKGLIYGDIKTKTVDYYKYLITAEKLLKEISLNGKIF